MEIRQVAHLCAINYFWRSQRCLLFEIMLTTTGDNAEDRSIDKLDSVIHSQNWVILRQDK